MNNHSLQLKVQQLAKAPEIRSCQLSPSCSVTHCMLPGALWFAAAKRCLEANAPW